MCSFTRAVATLGAVVLLAAGCGGDDGGGNDSPDASVSNCDMRMSFEPASPVAPMTVVASASIDRNGFPISMETFAWQVSFDGEPVTVVQRDPAFRSVEFAANAAGNYRVVLTGSLGGRDCADDVDTLTVQQPAANKTLYRLRMYPAMDHEAPVQQRVVEIPGGADFSLGTLSIETGVPVMGSVSSATGTALSAFLRLTRTGDVTWPVGELFSDASGNFTTRLMPGGYDVLVVPTEDGVAPAVISAGTASSVSSLTLPAGIAVSGSVVDSGGTPIPGASVSLRASGAPSTIGTTSVGGDFAVQGQPGDASVVVRPPDGTGLPLLEVAANAGVVASDGLVVAVAYAATTVRVFDVDVRLADGITPAPGAQVTFIARTIASAGTVTPQGGSAVAATGAVRMTMVADGAGKLVGVRVPEAVYDVIVVPAQGVADAIRIITMDLSGGAAAPAAFQLGGQATITGIARDARGAPLANVAVTAIAAGNLTGMPGAGATTVTDATGAYSIGVVGSGSYTLTFRAGDRAHAGHALSAVAPSAGASAPVPDVTLLDAIEVLGQVSLPGVGGARGVYVQLLCFDCSGAAASAPVAEAATDITGRFVLVVPDPGAGE